MKKNVLILIILAITWTNVMSQDNNVFIIKQKKNTILFGYINNKENDFFKVIDYIENQNVKVISYCQEEKLIFVLLNDENKDYMELFINIEKKFAGTCYFKSTENKLILYKKCHDQQVKKNMGGNE